MQVIKNVKEFAMFVERLEDAADYDNVAVYLALKRWSRLHYGDNPPSCVVRTLKILRDKFGPEQIARITAIPKCFARGLAQDSKEDRSE